MRAGAVQPRADRTDWQLESLGYTLVRKLLPREKEEGLALVARQRLDRVGNAREEQPRLEHRGARAPVGRLAARGHPRTRAQPPGLRAPVLQEQIRADPIQPRERGLARRVERPAPLERDPEQLADQPL